MTTVDGGVLTYLEPARIIGVQSRTRAYGESTLLQRITANSKRQVAGPVYAGGQDYGKRAQFERKAAVFAEVAGVVQTTAGAPVEGAKVTLVRREFGVVQSSMVTGPDGVYAFSVDSDPADYIAVASAPGGKTGASAANLVPTA